MFERMGMYYNKAGEAISMEDWSELKCGEGNPDYHRIGEQYIEGVTVDGEWIANLWVSTVWIGINMRFAPGPPIIFETMLFSENKVFSDEMKRYSTEGDAREGHQRTVECLHAGKAPFAWDDVEAP